mgnify:CR=1 FL=1
MKDLIKKILREEVSKRFTKGTSNAQSLIISGAASIVRNEFASASLSIQNLGTFADRSMNSVIDCGDGFF